MKKYILLYLSAIVTVLSILSCGSDSNEPSNNNDNADISESEFIFTPSGGDPRGIYRANTPSLGTQLTNTVSGYTLKNNFLFNTASGTITLDGTTSNSGSYTNNSYEPQIRGESSVLVTSAEIYSLKFPNQNDTGLFVRNTGTWKIVNRKIRFDDDIYKEYGYSVTSKGLFIHTDNEVKLNNIRIATVTSSLALRKQ